MPCERGWVDVAITLAPTMPPRVQYLRAQGVLPPGPEAVKAMSTILQLMNSWMEGWRNRLGRPASMSSG